MDELHFYYDAQGKPAIVLFNGTAYGYLYTLQGDVIAIVDGTGTKVVEYGYDAWGKPISKTGTMAGTLGTVQPFRYRGYVFDEETGLYYLRLRFFDAIHGRFINPDNINNGNLYFYCVNAPTNKCDAGGRAAFWITDESAVAGFGHTSLLLQSSVDGSWYYFYWGSADNSPIGPATVHIVKIDVVIKDGCYIDLNQLNDTLTDIHGEKPSYCVATYIPGEFDDSIDYATYLQKTSDDDPGVNEYHVFIRNCLRVSEDVLVVSFDESAYIRYFRVLGDQLIPNFAASFMKDTPFPTTRVSILGTLVKE